MPDGGEKMFRQEDVLPIRLGLSVRHFTSLLV